MTLPCMSSPWHFFARPIGLRDASIRNGIGATGGPVRRPDTQTCPASPRLKFLPVAFRSCMIKSMTDKQAVIDALQRLPEDVSIEEITEELRIMAAIRRGRADIAAGRT